MSGTIVNGALTVAVAAGSPLSAAGGMRSSPPSPATFWSRARRRTFVAVTAGCTHQACTVSNSTGQNYVCPCHGSEFDTSGRVIVGPAVQPLAQHPALFTGNVLTIT